MAGALSTVQSQGQVLASERMLAVGAPLAHLLPGAGLRRGSLVGVSGPGGSTLLFSLLAEPLGQGSWAGVVGLPDLGLEAAAQMGVDLARIALVPDPGPNWSAIAAVLLDAMDLVVLRPSGHCRPADAHRLAARARERGSVLLVVRGGSPWPERPDVELTAEATGWEGLGAGSGTLLRRPGRIVVSGRRAAGREGSLPCWLPGPDGRLTPRRSREEPLPERAAGQTPDTMAWAG
ncbi:MAG: hypothetical protein ACRDVW_01655 [Acidimicrobiales bacterium]